MSQHGKKRQPEEKPEPAQEPRTIIDIGPAEGVDNEVTIGTTGGNAGPAEDSPESKAREYWDRLVRTTADFENFRKRAAREKQEAISYANESLLKQLLAVLESFDKALSATADSKEASMESLQTGVNLILQQFKNVLSEAGVSEIDTHNQPFDPNWHEAVSQVESAEVPEGHVLLQLRKGYKLRDRLLRPAMVVVATPPATRPQV